MNDNYFFTNTFEATSRDADFSTKLRVGSLVNFFIQIAWQHAEQLGWGLHDLSKHGYFWVLSRLKFKIDEIPVWPCHLTIKTWPKGMNRLFYVRDAEFYNQENEKIIAVTSDWLIVDAKTKRPQKHETERDFMHIDFPAAIHETIPALQFQGKPDCSVRYAVKYTEIDMNQHLTTMRYIEFMFDTYDLDFFKQHQPKELTFNFLKEIYFGAQLIMYRIEKGNIHQFELVDETTQTVCFRAEVMY